MRKPKQKLEFIKFSIYELNNENKISFNGGADDETNTRDTTKDNTLTDNPLQTNTGIVIDTSNNTHNTNIINTVRTSIGGGTIGTGLHSTNLCNSRP